MRRVVLVVLALAAAFVLVSAYWYIHRSSRIPVLVYHVISIPSLDPSAATVSRELLANELDYLAQHGYTTLTLTQASALIHRHLLPVKAIVLTFDDADAGQYSYALPLLRAHHMVATFFPPSGWIGAPGKLTREDILALHNAGMEIGGHTRTHPHLFALTDAQLTAEIVGDKAALEKVTGTTITAFAYPFGEHDARIDNIVRDAGYTSIRGSAPDPLQINNGLQYFGASVMTNSFDVFLTALTPPTASTFSF